MKIEKIINYCTVHCMHKDTVLVAIACSVHVPNSTKLIIKIFDANLINHLL